MNKHDQLLLFLGCEQHEIATFHSLLGYPNGVSVVNLAKATASTRPTLYGHLDSLVEKGLARKFLVENSSLYAPQPLSILEEMYDEKLTMYQNNKSTLQDLIRDHREHVTRPRFSVHEHGNYFDSILMDMLRSRPDETLWVWPIEDMLDVIPQQDFEYFHAERKKRNIKLRVLWPEQSKESIKDHGYLFSADTTHREIRLLPKGIQPTIGYGVYNDKVAVISNNRESFGFIVESPEFAQTLASEFEYLWGQSKKYA